MKLSYAVLSLFLIMTGFSQVQNSSALLAIVGKDKITLNEFSRRYEDYLIYSGVKDNMPLRHSILNNMINEILLHGYDNNSKILNDPEYSKELEWAKKRTTLAFLKDREIYSRITVTENEIRQAFERTKTKLEVRHLYAPTLDEANKLYELLKIGVSFNELAEQTFTDSILKYNGGYLGYISWGSTDPDFEDAAYSLKIGEISKPVKTAQGYSIIKLENKVDKPLVTEYEYFDVKEKIKRAIKIKKKTPYIEAYLDKIFGKNKFDFNDAAVKSILTGVSGKKYPLEGNPFPRIFYENCVEYRGRTYSQKEIEKKLSETPQYDLERLTNAEAVKEAIKGLLMQEKLLEVAKSKGYDTVSYVNEAFRKIVNGIFLSYKKDEILSNVEFTDAELHEYYKSNIAFYTAEREMNVQEIIVNDFTLSNEIKKKLNDRNFGEMAKKYSVRKWSAKNYGRTGLAPASKFGIFEDTLWNIRIGEIIGPVKIEDNYCFFRVLEKRDGHPIDFDLVKPQIVEALRKEETFSIMNKYIESLSKKVEIKINQGMLKNYSLNLFNENVAG